MLELYNIRKAYSIGPTQTEILKGVSLYVEKGELVAIMGASGSGKSTLMHILGMLDQPTDGVYRLEGLNIGLLKDNAISRMRNRKIGFVFQSFYLLPRLTALENVGLPLNYRGLSEREIRQRSMEVLCQVQMEPQARHKPSQLSGGQQQRVAIARALAGKPALILADEPTGALDHAMSNEIMNLFEEINRELGITIVVITHDRQVAARCRVGYELVDGVLRERDAGTGWTLPDGAGDIPRSNTPTSRV